MISDAEKIFLHKVDDKELDSLKKKQKTMDQLLQQRPPSYNSFDQCKRLLMMGVIAHVYSFKGKNYFKVIITYDKNSQKLIFKNVDNQRCSSYKLFGNSYSFKLSKFKDLVYGGLTENFKRHRALLQR